MSDTTKKAPDPWMWVPVMALESAFLTYEILFGRPWLIALVACCLFYVFGRFMWDLHKQNQASRNYPETEGK